jgi:hypothetical protein
MLLPGVQALRPIKYYDCEQKCFQRLKNYRYSAPVDQFNERINIIQRMNDERFPAGGNATFPFVGFLGPDPPIRSAVLCRKHGDRGRC